MFTDTHYDRFESSQPAVSDELGNLGLLDLSLRMDELLAKFDSLKAAAAAPIERRAKVQKNTVSTRDGNELTQAGMLLIDW